MPRPYWSGQFRVSLVSFGIQLFPATDPKSEIHFHQLDRRTGERIKHQNVSQDASPVQKDAIVKGYEYTKGEYVVIEPEDFEQLRIPSRETFEVVQFVDREEVNAVYFEKPYFVTPQSESQSEAFAVVRKAMQAAKKIALGKIALSGREHLMAIAAPDMDYGLGMMAYSLRYSEELRDPKEFFATIKTVDVDSDQLDLATELIKRKSAKFEPEKFRDQYESALRQMVEAKIQKAPLPGNEPVSKSSKVVNLMDALRKSVQGNTGEKPLASSSPVSTVSSRTPTVQPKKIALVKQGSTKARTSKRKLA